MYIYVLKDPDTGVVRYVGRTGNPSKRMSSHLSRQRGVSLPSSLWIKSLKKLNKKPVMEIIEQTEDWENAEIKWIKFYRNMYPDLLNIDDGGVVSVWKHSQNKKINSKMYRSVTTKLINIAMQSNEMKHFWFTVRDVIYELRKDIFDEIGEDAVNYFDECIYAEFIERKPKSFRILA